MNAIPTVVMTKSKSPASGFHFHTVDPENPVVHPLTAKGMHVLIVTCDENTSLDVAKNAAKTLLERFKGQSNVLVHMNVAVVEGERSRVVVFDPYVIVKQYLASGSSAPWFPPAGVDRGRVVAP